jgi:hypothetical protein
MAAQSNTNARAEVARLMLEWLPSRVIYFGIGVLSDKANAKQNTALVSRVRWIHSKEEDGREKIANTSQEWNLDERIPSRLSVPNGIALAGCLSLDESSRREAFVRQAFDALADYSCHDGVLGGVCSGVRDHDDRVQRYQKGTRGPNRRVVPFLHLAPWATGQPALASVYGGLIVTTATDLLLKHKSSLLD